MSITVRLVSLLSLLAIIGLVGWPLRIAAQAPAAAPSDLNAAFVGDWTGQLEYRDYTTNERTYLPTWLKILESADHRSLVFSYVYDDGPAKTVRERVGFVLDPAARKATLTDRDETSSKVKTSVSTYEVSGLDEFRKTGRGVLVLTGAGEDNDKPADVRITITLRRNLYTARKEVRATGSVDDKDYEFRDGYLFTRARSPVAP
ncbi:MAG: hypothetical protein M3Y05_00635 [Gemmatimonadota bacterium]|nr:hypothetical protein [Gemmatimonadota bacterium]